jgi:hypothetical protein
MSAVIPRERIEQTILVIRRHRVMLDADLAKLYGVTTFNLNKAVKRNSDRVPRGLYVSTFRTRIGGFDIPNWNIKTDG